MKTLTQENIRFFDKIARYYDNRVLESLLVYLQKKSLELADIEANSKILDVGCGTGNLLLELGKRKDLKLYGIDISKEMLKIARSKINKKTGLKNSSIEEFKTKEKFNYILSTEAFHHFSNQEKAVENMHKLLKKDGKLVIVDLNFGFILNDIFHWLEPGNNKINSLSDFRKLFEKYEFMNISVKRIGLFAIIAIGQK